MPRCPLVAHSQTMLPIDVEAAPPALRLVVPQHFHCCHRAWSPSRCFITQAPPVESRLHQPVPKRPGSDCPGTACGFTDPTAAVFHLDSQLAPAEVPEVMPVPVRCNTTAITGSSFQQYGPQITNHGASLQRCPSHRPSCLLAGKTTCTAGVPASLPFMLMTGSHKPHSLVGPLAAIWRYTTSAIQATDNRLNLYPKPPREAIDLLPRTFPSDQTQCSITCSSAPIFKL